MLDMGFPDKNKNASTGNHVRIPPIIQNQKCNPSIQKNRWRQGTIE